MTAMKLRCRTCKQPFAPSLDECRLGRAQCPHCASVAGIPVSGGTLPPPIEVELPHTFTSEAMPASVEVCQTNRSNLSPSHAIPVAPPPPSNQEVATSHSNMIGEQPLIESEPTERETLGRFDVTTRAQTLACDKKSQRQWKKNVVIWVVCTLILIVAVAVLVRITG